MRYQITVASFWLAGQAFAADDYVAHNPPTGRYALDSSRPTWPSGTIPWYYNPTNQPASLDTDTVVAVFINASRKWENLCNVHFVYKGITLATPNLDASYLNTDGLAVFGWAALMGSRQNFDGYTSWWWKNANGTPKLFDTDVVINTRSGFDASRLHDLGALLTHEIGHMLAIKHSDVQNAVMFANPYNAYSFQATLRGDDASACAALYGATANAETDRAFNWAEQTYPDAFAPTGGTSFDGYGYHFRYYAETQNYVGVQGGQVYYLPVGGDVALIGSLDQFLAPTRAAGF